VFFSANGVVFSGPTRFWVRDTKTSAFWIAGSFSLAPIVRSASIMNCVLERSGRPFRP